MHHKRAARTELKDKSNSVFKQNLKTNNIKSQYKNHINNHIKNQ